MLLLVLLTADLRPAAVAQPTSPDDSPQAAASEDPAETVGRGGKLRRFNPLVGEWRGVGQPQRGSRRGAWTETGTCLWDFTADEPTIRFDSEGGQQFEFLQLGYDPQQQQLVLMQQLDDETVRRFSGPLPQQWPARLQLDSAPEPDGSSYRCTIEQLNEIRLVVLFERRATPTGSFRRVAGIGYTRAGERLAQSGTNSRICVVTGGQGTLAVTHQGQTWYVCCEGCRQVFEQSPDEVIAEYRRSLKQQSAAE